MKFVKLLDANGNENWVRPDKVVAVAVDFAGNTVIVFDGEMRGAVKGTPEEVVRKLEEA